MSTHYIDPRSADWLFPLDHLDCAEPINPAEEPQRTALLVQALGGERVEGKDVHWRSFDADHRCVAVATLGDRVIEFGDFEDDGAN